MVKAFIILGVIGLIVIGSLFLIPNSPTTCDEFGVVYLKASELHLASDIANNINGIVVIPELEQIIGRTEILECENFDYSEYIRGFE